jgi:8-oxo-dGTP diphosphatase
MGRHLQQIITVRIAHDQYQHHELKKMDNELHWHQVVTLSEMAFDHKKSWMFVMNGYKKNPEVGLVLPQKFSLRELQNL